VDQAAFSFSVKPLSSHTGAEVCGIDLGQPVEEAIRAALNHAFADHAVLVISRPKAQRSAIPGGDEALR
jgi:alpha-ketoglutarate-dependent taurine dioxygenase